MDMDSRHHTTPELPPLENRKSKTLRANPDHFQVVHQPAVDPTWYDNYTVDAPGTFESLSGTSDAHQYTAMEALANAPGMFGSTPDASDAEPYAAVNVSNLTTSRIPQHLLQHGEASPVSRPPRYAQTNTQSPNWLHEQLVCDNRTGMAIFPPGITVPNPTVPYFPPMGRTQVGPNPTVPLQDHDRSEDNSRSSRGHGRAGQAQYEEDSHNLTNDLNEMLTTTGASITEFRSPISSPDGVIVGGVRGVAERTLGSEEHRQGHDNSRSMRGRVPTGPTWFETSDHGIVIDLCFSPQDTRTAIVNATQDLGSVPWIDGADRQMVTRLCQATPLYHYIGDDRDLRPNIVQYVGSGMMTPSSILPQDMPVPVPLQKTNYAIYDAGPTRSSMTMGAPVLLGPGSERYDTRMGGTADLTTGPTRPLPQGNTEHTHVRSRVAAIEERWFHAAVTHDRKGKHRTNPLPTCQTVGKGNGTRAIKGKGAGTQADVTNNNTSTGYSTPPPAAKRTRTKAASSKASGSSRASQSLDGHKQQRLLEERHLASATAARKVALADQEIADSGLRISEMDAHVNRPRGESRVSSDTSSKASGAFSSHRSRGNPRMADSEKSTPLAAQLEEMLSSVQENTATVEYSDVLQPEAGPASTRAPLGVHDREQKYNFHGVVVQ
jgi:hypothetical protein